MGVSRDRSPTEANDDVRTAEIGGISHSDWDPAEEDWGRGRLMGAPDRTSGTGANGAFEPIGYLPGTPDSWRTALLVGWGLDCAKRGSTG